MRCPEHPVSSGKLTWHQYWQASTYLLKKQEVMMFYDKYLKILKKKFQIIKQNASILCVDPELKNLQPLPVVPRLSGKKTSEDEAYVFKIVEEFLGIRYMVEEMDIDDLEGTKNDLIEEEANDSGCLTSSPFSPVPTDDRGRIELTEEIEQTLLYTFQDLCIDLVNGIECEDIECRAKHFFPTAQTIRQHLENHTEEQIDRAYELVLRSNVLKKRYLEVFKP